MLTSFGTGDQPNIHIEGGLWGFDYGAGGPMTWGPVTVSFTYVAGSGNPGTSIISFGGGLLRSDFGLYTQAVYLFGVPTSANNNRVFAFAPVQTGISANQIRVIGKVTDETGIAGFTAQVVPPAGGGFRLLSTGGMVRSVNLINTRGIAFIAGGDTRRCGPLSSVAPALSRSLPHRRTVRQRGRERASRRTLAVDRVMRPLMLGPSDGSSWWIAASTLLSRRHHACRAAGPVIRPE